VHEDLAIFREVAEFYDMAEETVTELSLCVQVIEEWARVRAAPVTHSMPDSRRLDGIREGWLGGVGLSVLIGIETDASIITREFYGYQLPWIIHAAAQQLRGAGDAVKADVLAKISLLVELGVPTDHAAHIFLAGVRSRVSATELASFDIDLGVGIHEISATLRSDLLRDHVRPLVSDATAVWLDLLVEDASRSRRQPVPNFPSIALEGAEGAEVLHVRRLKDDLFLATVDGRIRIAVEPTDAQPYDSVANDPGIAFRRSNSGWIMAVRDPRRRGARSIGHKL
jgi:hypothetical protein